MTDTVSPITEPHLTPMFATGGQPALTPNTEPHPAPIFDTGPHPDPLQTDSADAAPQADSAAHDVEWHSDEWESAAVAVDAQPVVLESPLDTGTRMVIVQSASDPAAESVAAESVSVEPVSVEPGEDSGAEPALAGIAADLDAAVDALDADPKPPQAFSEYDSVDTDAFLRSVTGHIEPVSVPVHPVVVPSAYQFVKRWKFALIVAGVWVLSAMAGAGFYYWWYTALDKTIPVLGILLYLVVCMVASLLVSMVPNRPQVTALAIALMAAPLASMGAAAVLHGAYYFEWITRPTIG